MGAGIQPDKLLEHAERLAGFDAPAGRPREADLRRAVSGAYYALYHELIGRAVEQAMPGAGREDRAKAARWFNHTDIKSVCDWVVECATSPTPKKIVVESGVWSLFSAPGVGGGRVGVVPAQLAFIADSFITLMSARHEADYDHEASFPRASAQSQVRAARTAVRALRAERADPHVQKFLVLLLARASRLR